LRAAEIVEKHLKLSKLPS